MEHTAQKDGEEHDREHVDSVVSQQDLVDSYMYPFQACVEKGGVSGLMCTRRGQRTLHARVAGGGRGGWQGHTRT